MRINSIFLTYGSPDVDIMLESILGKNHGKLSMCRTKDTTLKHNLYIEIIYAFDASSIDRIALSPLGIPIYKKIILKNRYTFFFKIIIYNIFCLFEEM